MVEDHVEGNQIIKQQQDLDHKHKKEKLAIHEVEKPDVKTTYADKFRKKLTEK